MGETDKKAIRRSAILVAEADDVVSNQFRCCKGSFDVQLSKEGSCVGENLTNLPLTSCSVGGEA